MVEPQELGKPGVMGQIPLVVIQKGRTQATQPDRHHMLYLT